MVIVLLRGDVLGKITGDYHRCLFELKALNPKVFSLFL